MKPTVKVSIGGMAYTLDEDAYFVLEDYLKSLNKHFGNNAEKTEIVADIEMRISELLQLQLNNTNSVISINNIQEVLSIMGSPHDFGDEESSEGSVKPEQTENEFEKFRKKRIYRDQEHAIIGGVCSGLSHYFKTDPVIIRLIWILITVLAWSFSAKTMMFVVWAYGILWVIVPKAKTFAQRVSMRNAASPIENIENRTQYIPTGYKGSGIGKAIKLIFRVFVGLIGVAFFLIFLIALVGIIWINFDSQMGGVDLLAIMGLNNLNFKILFALPILLPLLGVCYICYKIAMSSPFTTRDWAMSFIIIALWGISGIYVVCKTVGMSKMYRYNKKVTEEFHVPATSDTFYVKTDRLYENARQLGWMRDYKYSFFLKVKDTDGQDALFSQIHVSVSEDSTLTDYKVSIEKQAFEESPELALRKAENARLDYEINQSALVVSPHLYNEYNQWDREIFSIKVVAPIGKSVIIEYPLQ